MGYQVFGDWANKLRSPEVISASQIRGGIITGKQLIVAGGTHGVIRSENYDGTDGWAIFGDGSAYFGGAFTLGADLYSSNWNGGFDLSTGFDPTATTGWLLDWSSGAGQFSGNLFLDGDLTVGKNAPNVVISADTWQNGIYFFTGEAAESDPGALHAFVIPAQSGVGLNSPRMEYTPGQYVYSDLVMVAADDGSKAWSSLTTSTNGTANSQVTIESVAFGTGSAITHIKADANSGTAAIDSWINTVLTTVVDSGGFAVVDGSTAGPWSYPSISFIYDRGMGFRRKSSGVMAFSTGYVDRFTFDSTGIRGSGWFAPVLQNSWTDYNPATYQVAGYCKDATGRVHLRGLIKGGTTGVNVILFQLPAGMRPTNREVFTVWNAAGPVRCDVDASGYVRQDVGWSNSYASLGGISFDTV